MIMASICVCSAIIGLALAFAGNTLGTFVFAGTAIAISAPYLLKKWAEKRQVIKRLRRLQ